MNNDNPHKQLNSPIILIVLLVGTFIIVWLAYQAIQRIDSVTETAYSAELIES